MTSLLKLVKFISLIISLGISCGINAQNDLIDSLNTRSNVDTSKYIYQEPKYPYFGPNIPPYIAIVGGIDGIRTSFWELGLTFNVLTTEMHPNTGAILGGAFSYKKHFSKNIQATELELGFYSFLSMGLNFNYSYSGLDKTFGVKPFLGICLYHFQILWGYNFYAKTSISELNHSTIKFRYSIPIIRLNKKRKKST